MIIHPFVMLICVCVSNQCQYSLNISSVCNTSKIGQIKYQNFLIKEMIFSLKQVKEIQQGLQKLLNRSAVMVKTPKQSALNSPRRLAHLKPTTSYKLKHQKADKIHQPIQKHSQQTKEQRCVPKSSKNKTLVDAFLNTLMTTNRFDCDNYIDLNQLRSKSLTQKKEAEERLLNMRIYVGGKPNDHSKSQMDDVIPSFLMKSPSQSKDESSFKQTESKDIKCTGKAQQDEEFKILKPSEMHKQKPFLFKQRLKISIQNNNNALNESKELKASANDYQCRMQDNEDELTSPKNDACNKNVKKTLNKTHIRTQEQFLIKKYNYQINQKENPIKSQLLKTKYKNLDKRLQMIKKGAIQHKPKIYSSINQTSRKQLQDYKRYSPLAKLYEFNNILRGSQSISPLKH